MFGNICVVVHGYGEFRGGKGDAESHAAMIDGLPFCRSLFLECGAPC